MFQVLRLCFFNMGYMAISLRSLPSQTTLILCPFRVSNCPQPACNSGVSPLEISLEHLCRSTGFSVPVLLPSTSRAHCQAHTQPWELEQHHPSTTGKLQCVFSLSAPAGTNRILFSTAGTNARHLIYFLKNSSNAVCRIIGWSRNLICRKIMHWECSLHSLWVQRVSLQLEEQCAFNAAHKNLLQAPTNSNWYLWRVF